MWSKISRDCVLWDFLCIISFFIYKPGCPDQLMRTTINSRTHWAPCKPGRQVRHRESDRRVRWGLNPGCKGRKPCQHCWATSLGACIISRCMYHIFCYYGICRSFSLLYSFSSLLKVARDEYEFVLGNYWCLLVIHWASLLAWVPSFLPCICFSWLMC